MLAGHYRRPTVSSILFGHRADHGQLRATDRAFYIDPEGLLREGNPSSALGSSLVGAGTTTREKSDATRGQDGIGHWEQPGDRRGGGAPSCRLDNIPLKRLGAPGDIAGVAAFLASSDADYITGTTVVVDGGLLWNYEEQ